MRYNENMRLTERQKKILQIIVDNYVYTSQPISSKEIITNHMPELSSATIRNEMAILEKYNLLEKTHISSGRIPSVNGYQYYEEHILQPKVSTNIKSKLQKIFAQRNLSIDTVIDQSVSIINESLKLPSVLTTSQSNELLKRFDLVQISEKTALVIIITSSGSIVKKTIDFIEKQYLNDIATCIRIFNDRLIDTPVHNINSKLNSIKEIIRNAVHEYEYCIRQVIEKIFDFNIDGSSTNVTGTR
jgi:heat-inducible transcriptional repressor